MESENAKSKSQSHSQSNLENNKFNSNSLINLSYYFPKINLNVVNMNFTNTNEKDNIKIIESDKDFTNMNTIDTKTTNDKSPEKLNLELDDIEEKHRAEYRAHLNCQKMNWERKSETSSYQLCKNKIQNNNSDSVLKQKGRYFIIKSLDEDNIHKSIKYKVWCSTFKGNEKLNLAFKNSIETDSNVGHEPIYLFFSVNGSGRFLGYAQMTSMINTQANFNYWSQGQKWKGFFNVNWIEIKDIPNSAFRNIQNGYNENKPVFSSRDTQEIDYLSGIEMMRVFKSYKSSSSILDDFQFYDEKEVKYSKYFINK